MIDANQWSYPQTGATRNTLIAFSAQTANFIINFGVAVALARLLAPADFGLVAIGLAITGFFEFARHGGVIVPVIQIENITPAQRNTLFWFNSGLGLALTVVLVAVAPLAGFMYADTRLTPLVAALALGFLLSGLSTQHVALLRRERRFFAIATCELAALLLAGALAIWTALHDAHYWALVVFQLAREGLQTLFQVIAARWRPSWPTRGVAVGTLLKSGGMLMAFDILGYFNFKVDNLIVGWRLGSTALGFYGKAYELVLLPANQILTPLSIVVHSSLSRLQHDETGYRAFLSRALLVSTGLGLPLTAFLFANANTLIVQILGEQWQAAAPIYRALAPAAATMTVTACVGWIFLSLDRARRQLWWSMLTTVATIAAFVVGTRGNAIGVALALSLTRVVFLVPTLIFTCHGTFIPWRTLLAIAVRPALASALALASSLLLDSLYAVDVWTIPRNTIAFLVTYIVCWMLTRTGRELLRQGLTLAGLTTSNV